VPKSTNYLFGQKLLKICSWPASIKKMKFTARQHLIMEPARHVCMTGGWSRTRWALLRLRNFRSDPRYWNIPKLLIHTTRHLVLPATGQKMIKTPATLDIKVYLHDKLFSCRTTPSDTNRSYLIYVAMTQNLSCKHPLCDVSFMFVVKMVWMFGTCFTSMCLGT
jgi:hypothetical protein